MKSANLLIGFLFLVLLPGCALPPPVLSLSPAEKLAVWAQTPGSIVALARTTYAQMYFSHLERKISGKPFITGLADPQAQKQYHNDLYNYLPNLLTARIETGDAAFVYAMGTRQKQEAYLRALVQRRDPNDLFICFSRPKEIDFVGIDHRVVVLSSGLHLENIRHNEIAFSFRRDGPDGSWYLEQMALMGNYCAGRPCLLGMPTVLPAL